MGQKRYEVSRHGKERIRQRTDISKGKDINRLFLQAIHNGKSPADFKPPFSCFLKSKLRDGKQVKVYQNMIFIYKNKRLITAYNVPDRFLHLNDSDMSKELQKELESMSNKEVKEYFTSNYDMFISLLQIIYIVNQLEDDELCGDLGERWLKLSTTINNLLCRVGEAEDIKLEVDLTVDNLIPTMKDTLEKFTTLTSNYVGFGASKSDKTMEERYQDTRDFTALIRVFKQCLDFAQDNNYLLRPDVQNQGIE